MMSLIMGKAVTTRDIITPPPHLINRKEEQKEYSEGILSIVNNSARWRNKIVPNLDIDFENNNNLSITDEINTIHDS